MVIRAWFYFRQGYSTYLTFLLGYVSTLVTVYYPAIKNMPPLLDLFPHFAEFAIIATVVGAPSCDLNRMGAPETEQLIQQRS